MSEAVEVRKIDGELDEIVADECALHIEQMDVGNWWICITAGDKTYHLNLYTKRSARIFAALREE